MRERSERACARACAGAHARSVAVASVHGWERVGSLLATILRRELRAVILRYVDDLFGIGMDSGSEALQTSWSFFRASARRIGRRLLVSLNAQFE